MVDFRGYRHFSSKMNRFLVKFQLILAKFFKGVELTDILRKREKNFF